MLFALSDFFIVEGRGLDILPDLVHAFLVNSSMVRSDVNGIPTFKCMGYSFITPFR